MPLIAPAFTTINPSMMLPQMVLPYSQASGAFDLLPDEEPRVMLGEGDLAIYIPRLDFRSRMSAGQSAYNQLPSVDVVVSQISTPTYLQRVRSEYDHHDTAAAGRNGFSLVEAMRLGTQQAHANSARTALLYGYNPANGEGLANANGATAVNLPPDSYGNDTVVTYDNGQMAFFLMQQVQQIKSRTNQLGLGNEFTIIGPQRTLGSFEYNVVQVVQFQRPGAGTTSTAGVFKEVLMANGDKVIWGYDDTLINKGAGGNTDLVLIVMPKVKKPAGNRSFNTNRFAELQPGLDATVDQFCDMKAPREITVPLAGGAVDTLSELRITSGWAIRPEAVTAISMQYQ
jgi:hypothetical protein